MTSNNILLLVNDVKALWFAKSSVRLGSYKNIKTNKYVWMTELILKLTKTVLFSYIKSCSYSLCTKSIWFKTVFKTSKLYNSTTKKSSRYETVIRFVLFKIWLKISYVFIFCLRQIKIFVSFLEVY